MTVKTFCDIVWDLSPSEVSLLIKKTDYNEFTIPKKSGVRIINFLPHTSSLFTCQKALIRYLNRQDFPDCVKGFIKRENYLTYLEPHVGAEFFLRVDIKDFFSSITEDTIKNELECLMSFDSEEDKKEILDLISSIVTYKGVVPQGAPCSPIISNVVMIRIDQRITKYCQSLGIYYTRYADDMLFSSSQFDFLNRKWFIKKIKYILLSQNLRLNYSKTKYAKDEISLNGYVVSKNGIRLSRERLYDIRSIVAFSKTHSYLAKSNPELFLTEVNLLQLKHRDLKNYPFKKMYQYLQFLCGYRAYLISFTEYDIDPKFAKKINKLVQIIEEQLRKY